MNDTFLDLYNEFLVFVEKNDEEGARKFLTDNLDKFPEEVQEKLTFAFFEEALLNKAQNIKDMAKIQKDGLDAMDQIGKTQKVLEDKIKEEDLRSKLTKE